MKLLVAIPSYRTMPAEFVKCLIALTGRLSRDGIPHEVKILDGTMVHAARDSLARHAVNNGFSEVLWIDSDMVFSDSLYDDLKTCGKDMVCGLFISRHNPYLNCLFSRLGDKAERITEITGTDAFRVAGCGFGAVLMQTQVLRDVMTGTHGKCFIPEPNLGEDLAFCQRAAGAGYEIWCEPTARVGHIGEIVIWPEDGPRLRGEIHELDGKALN